MDDRTRHLVGVGTEAAHADRAEALRRLARELDGPALDEVLAELWSGDRVLRGVAIFLAEVGDRPEFLRSALADADATEQIRILSAHTLSKLPVDAVSELLRDAPSAVRHRVYRSIRRRRHHPLADELIGPVRQWWGDREAARLLPVCSPHVITGLLPELAHAVVSWRPLATRHPDIHRQELERRLTELPPTLHDDCWWRHDDALPVLAAQSPHRLLDLLERFGPAHRLPSVVQHSRTLARADPGRYVRLLRGPGRVPWLRRSQPSRSVFKVLAAADTPELVELAAGGRLPHVLAALPPSRREAVYDAVHSGRVAHADTNLPLLPAPRRHREARERVERLRRAGSEDAALAAAVCLPPDEARAELDPLRDSGEAVERAHGHQLLIECAAGSRDPHTVAEVVTDVTGRIRNEQDPVRSEALEGIARLSPHLLVAVPADVLDRLTRDAIRARDRSAGTEGALGGVALRVLSQRGDTSELGRWAVHTLATLFVEADRLPYRLPPDVGQELWQAVRSHVREQNARGRFEPLLRLAGTLGNQARDLPELQEQLRHCIERGTESVSRQAVDRWLEDPRQRGARVAEVLELDRSAIALDSVQHAVFLLRPDLFRDALPDGAEDAGKFLPGGGPWTPIRSEGVDRLAPDDQRRYADRLAGVVADAGEGTPRRVAAVHALARVPGLGRGAVERWTDSEDVYLAEAALGALARTDEPEHALGTLLAHGSDDRARVAMTAAARCARHVRPTGLAGSLRQALRTSTKVTGRKQLVHISTLLSPETAVDTILEVWRGPEEHRDVRAACVAVALRLLEVPRTWSMLHESLGAAREVTEPLFTTHPLDLAEQHRSDYAALLVTAAARAEGMRRHEAAQALPMWHSFDDGVARWLVETITDLDRRAWSGAVSALVRLVAAGEASEALETAVRRLAEAVPGDDAHDERDLPARQRLHSLVQEWGSSALRISVSPRPLLVRLGDVLIDTDPTLLPLAVSMRTRHTIRTDDPENTLHDLRELARLHHGRPMLAGETSHTLHEHAAHVRAPDNLLPAARALAASGQPVEGRFAVALCAGARYRRTWTRQWRDCLRDLRAHPEPEVAEAALAVFTAQE